MATRKKTGALSRAETPHGETGAPKAVKSARASRPARALHATAPAATVTQMPLLFSAPRPPRVLDHTPAHPAVASTPERSVDRGTSVRQRFGELRGLLAEGWEIVQPIFARPLWSTPDNSTTAFNFVLRRENATRLLTVPEGRTVQRFIRDRNLLVDYRS